jgi:c(7)-type cytochrome triheme protein
MCKKTDPRNHPNEHEIFRSLVSFRVGSCRFVDRTAWLQIRTTLCIICVCCIYVVSFCLARAGSENVAVAATKAVRSTNSQDLKLNNSDHVSCNSCGFLWIRGSDFWLEVRRLRHRVAETSTVPRLFQGPELDYSKFLHTSQRHSSLACTDCHDRPQDNSPLPRFPGHKACSNCHLSQFVTPAVPMCLICHTDTASSNPPLKSFPARFNESFNVKFDHAQHMTQSARPQNGCSGCHDRSLRRGVALSIPASLAAHSQCYVCHTPASKTSAGREMASCGVCHDQKRYSPTSTNALAFRYAFSHAEHGPRQRLQCSTCHTLTAGAPQTRQVSSPSAREHFPTSRGMNCATCHNGKRAFGGDLDFKTCRRCHTAATFRMPL